jgi:hypothetical protein
VPRGRRVLGLLSDSNREKSKCIYSMYICVCCVPNRAAVASSPRAFRGPWLLRCESPGLCRTRDNVQYILTCSLRDVVEEMPRQTASWTCSPGSLRDDPWFAPRLFNKPEGVPGIPPCGMIRGLQSPCSRCLGSVKGGVRGSVDEDGQVIGRISRHRPASA